MNVIDRNLQFLNRIDSELRSAKWRSCVIPNPYDSTLRNSELAKFLKQAFGFNDVVANIYATEWDAGMAETEKERLINPIEEVF